MRESIEDLVRAVSRSIEDEVLPALDAASWPASRLRGALMLLRHVEDRASHERRVLIETNALIRRFLDDAGSGALKLAPGLRAIVAPDQLPDPAPDADMPALTAANEACKEALGRLIRRASEERSRPAAEDDGLFRSRLHELLRRIEQNERVLTDAALQLSPI